MTSINHPVEAQVNPLGVQKMRTMIEGFDDISHGGLPVARTTIVSGTSGTGKTMFAVQFLYNGISYFDEPGIFVTFEESPADIIKNAYSFGWDLQKLIDDGNLLVDFLVIVKHIVLIITSYHSYSSQVCFVLMQNFYSFFYRFYILVFLFLLYRNINSLLIILLLSHLLWISFLLWFY